MLNTAHSSPVGSLRWMRADARQRLDDELLKSDSIPYHDKFVLLLEAMVQAAPSDWWRVFIRLGVATGLRNGGNAFPVEADDADPVELVLEQLTVSTTKFSEKVVPAQLQPVGAGDSAPAAPWLDGADPRRGGALRALLEGPGRGFEG